MTTSAAFDRGASRYDLMVALNPGYHRELQRAAAKLVGRLNGSTQRRLVDLACGSGASTRALLAEAPADAEILGLDASRGMLAAATAKSWPARVRFERAVAGEIDVDAIGRGSIDGILTCYLFRNVPTELRDRAIGEVFELLRPGGWLVVQEYSVAGDRAARVVWDVVSHAVIIPLGTIIDRNPGLYRYLWRSVVSFDAVDAFAGRLRAAGFTDVTHDTARGWQRGVLHTFVARKPDGREGLDTPARTSPATRPAETPTSHANKQQGRDGLDTPARTSPATRPAEAPTGRAAETPTEEGKP
ncbi:class I SAM-dependent methyltransferase [Tessaracoccus sp. OS52]|uniref:class I SAM-dependent methyltransferase n=1 Tax=Tessaracoccus sp. OS52 TaxID=2886691 RepID=UPI001D105E65|nr:class I SAM-dependent methyltransferase [Tessaracoccus sp. OS52]MCC2594097.1 class I SAM-dependent methyltransferase [Tessaracoccus sp. OS52]